MELETAAHPEDPARDMVRTETLLREVAAGARGATARVFRPGPTVAFGRLDALRPGYEAAAAAAKAHGCVPVRRLGGGHAAAYDPGSVVVELVTPAAVVAEGLQGRFASGTDVLVRALTTCGLAVEVGELPGEYCPGRWSIHLVGGPKVAGAAQRAVRGAALFTAVVVVEGGDRIRAVLEDVYAALGLAWDPATAGGAADALPGLTAITVAGAVVAALGFDDPAG